MSGAADPVLRNVVKVKVKALPARRFTGAVTCCALILLLAMVISPSIGLENVSLRKAWTAMLAGDIKNPDYFIVMRVRLPRSLLAMLSGSTLALCGVVFQALFRNPLATPYTLGIASGGALGALIAIKLGLVAAFFGISTLPVLSFMGSLLVVAVVGAWARTSIQRRTTELLLAGVAMGMFCSALMMFVTYLADERDQFQMVRWMMGSLDTIGPRESTMLLPFLLPAWAVLLFHGRALNQYGLGDELAATRGVSVVRLQAICVGFCSLAIGAVVAVCGPVGFVDLIVPHAVRRVVGNDNRLLLPCSALLGAAFLMVCDWLSLLLPRWYGSLTARPLTAATLPIGVITALVGAPVFLIMLRKRTGLFEPTR